jgi:hypothetical protein
MEKEKADLQMSAADVGARVYRVIDNDVYTAPGIADTASAETILVRMTGNKPHNLNLLSKNL